MDNQPVRITMPVVDGRFQSLRAINQDAYIVSPPYVVDQEKVGTRYLYVAVRTLADPNNPEDLKTARALQDQTPDWGGASTFVTFRTRVALARQR